MHGFAGDPGRACRRCASGIAVLFAFTTLGNGVTPETVTAIELGDPAPTWFIVKSGLGSGYVFDAADGEMIGTLSLTPSTPTVRRHPDRGEIYAAETHFTRRYDGDREDVLRIYAHSTLSPIAEVGLPPKIAALHRHYLGVLAGGRFVAVFNMSPAQSVAIVDVESRRFVDEVSTPGCALTLPVSEGGFLMMCGDGTLQWIALDAEGAEASRSRSERFFSVADDPLFDQPTATSAGWQLLSFAGSTMEARVEDGEIVIGDSWSLVGEDDDGWRPGGGQPTAFNASLDLLIALMHEGGEDTHEQDGTEAWVFHRGDQRRIGKIKFDQPASALLVIEDEKPLLLAAIGAGVHVFELPTGRRLRIVETGRGASSLLRY